LFINSGGPYPFLASGLISERLTAETA